MVGELSRGGRRDSVAGEADLSVWWELIGRSVVDEPSSVGWYQPRVDSVVDCEHGCRRRGAETVGYNPRTGDAVDQLGVVEM